MSPTDTTGISPMLTGARQHERAARPAPSRAFAVSRSQTTRRTLTAGC